MMKKIFSLSLAISFMSTLTVASENVHWGYAGNEGPENWAKLSSEFSACAGKNQSPVNLTDFIEADLNKIEFSYKPGGNEIINNGHSIQVNYEPGSTISLNGLSYGLKQFHFHSPSENRIDSKSFPLEAHLVHTNQNGDIAVVAIMYTEGEENGALARFWPLMPSESGVAKKLENIVSATALLPTEHEYYLFNGSLTTPPCTEGVRWIVFKQPVTIAKKQVEAFKKIMHHDNNRPVQPVNARPILQ
ncbi:MAG: carbonic anhydrase family protein [Desulforhopalus sp.]